MCRSSIPPTASATTSTPRCSRGSTIASKGFSLPAISRRAGGRDEPPRVTYGTVLTGDQFLHDESARRRLHAELGGSAVDMEGAAVAQVCEGFGIPWLLIRALSDLAGRESRFDFTAFVDEVAAGSAAILRRLLPVL